MAGIKDITAVEINRELVDIVKRSASVLMAESILNIKM